ncbi:hypothetical protein KDAU_02460 [Dictyobacter aurantiacus]|uniref:Uncharacterized protein n=1 Tax=Dictyobacter aurantiacus TaxID=1936993 RepID=A0A401Z7S8_9CHLR|nr:hypothetical protein KDAU_02460 [Dictyobacter aurantiacus]
MFSTGLSILFSARVSYSKGRAVIRSWGRARAPRGTGVRNAASLIIEKEEDKHVNDDEATNS